MKRKWSILGGVVIAVLLIGIISAGCRAIRSVGRDGGHVSQAARPAAVPPVQLGERKIIVTQQGSEIVPCLDERRHSLHLAIRILDDNVPYTAYYNGGKKNGGIDVYYPPRRDRPPGWKSSKPEGYEATYVTFQLPAGYPPVQLSCTLSRN